MWVAIASSNLDTASGCTVARLPFLGEEKIGGRFGGQAASGAAL